MENLTKENIKLKQQIDGHQEAINFYSKFKVINPTIRGIIDNEIKNSGKPAKRYRFDQKIKNFCIFISSTSAHVYATLSSIFTWPSPRTLLKELDHDSLKCGITNSTLERIKNYNLEDQEFSLLFDEVHLKPALSYSRTFEEIDGLSDYGEEIKLAEHKVAKSSLVFMLRSTTKSIKIPGRTTIGHS